LRVCSSSAAGMTAATRERPRRARPEARRARSEEAARGPQQRAFPSRRRASAGRETRVTAAASTTCSSRMSSMERRGLPMRTTRSRSTPSHGGRRGTRPASVLVCDSAELVCRLQLHTGRARVLRGTTSRGTRRSRRVTILQQNRRLVSAGTRLSCSGCSTSASAGSSDRTCTSSPRT
jgi:hypothetical protein